MRGCLAIRFAGYLERVFGFGSLVAGLRDTRPKPQVPTGAAFLSAFFPLAFRCRSLLRAEGLLRLPGRLDALVGRRKLGADRIGDVFAMTAPDSLRSLVTSCVHRLGRNKALVSPWQTTWGVVDGHEFFSR